jgi:hypothetical protein
MTWRARFRIESYLHLTGFLCSVLMLYTALFDSPVVSQCQQKLFQTVLILHAVFLLETIPFVKKSNNDSKRQLHLLIILKC